MLKKFASASAALIAGLALGAPAMAAVSAAEAAKLGAELTPLGGEKAANADGSIPAWDGGLTSAAQAGFANFRPGQHHPDPYASDKPLYTVTAANMGQYGNKLTEGHKKLLQTYRNTFKMIVYPTHRSAAAPQRIYDATKRIATTAQLAKGGNGVTNAGEGIPFAIPKEGVEVFWNHVLRYRGDVIVRQIGQAPVTASGAYTMVKFHDETMVAYSLAGAKSENLDNTIAYFIQETVAPARLAGEVLLVQETLDQSLENRRAWVYNPGQRRVRRAPNVAFDNPGTNSDNLRTSDQFDMYNGSPQRYDWTLVGKKEILVPYNSYKLHSNTLKYTDILKKNHINPERGALRAASRLGGRFEAQGGPEPPLQPPHAIRGRRQLAHPRGRLLRQPWPALSRAGRPRHSVLRRAGPVDRARDRVRPVERPLPRTRPRQRRTAQPRLHAEAHGCRLPAGRSAAARRPVSDKDHRRPG